MGREIRRVPPNYEHQKDEAGKFIPQLDSDYETAALEWIDGFEKHRRGEHKSEYAKEFKYYWEYEMPPEADGYRQPFDVEPTWYQVYETVSEGTPVTPPFETIDELVEYLVNQGDFWNNEWDRSAAENFAEDGFAMSLACGPKTNGLRKPNEAEYWNR